MKKILIAVAALVVVAAIAVVAVVTLGGDDEQTVRGTCGTSANYVLTVEEEDGGLEVAYELQSAAPGETWTVLVEQGDAQLLTGERQTDEDAELDLDAPAQNDGDDTFTVTATPENGEACVATLTR